MQIRMVVNRAARTFTFDVKSPPTSWLLLQCAGADKGSALPGKEKVGKPVTLKHVFEIAKIKQSVRMSTPSFDVREIPDCGGCRIHF